MHKPTALLFLALSLAACSRKSMTGTYQTVGSEDKFRIVMDVRSDGHASFTTQSNLGRIELDQALQSTMTIPDGRWKDEAGKLIVTGVQGEGKPVTYRFTVQPNGDLFWEQNGARLAKTK